MGRGLNQTVGEKNKDRDQTQHGQERRRIKENCPLQMSKL